MPSTEVEFTTFRETYRIITFNMILGMLYPNPETDRLRAIGIGLTIISMTPLCGICLLEIWNSWQYRDIVNIIRQSTVVGPLAGSMLKMILLYIYRAEAYDIIKAIDEDYTRYNTLPETHKAIARKVIRDSQFYSERCWAVLVLIAVLVFPCQAAILNVYNSLFKSEPTLYMVHDMNKPFSEPEERFESPFFELMFAYSLYMTLILILSFTSFDPFFGVSINHVCLKLELLCEELDDAMLERDASIMFTKMVNAIKEHNDVFRLGSQEALMDVIKFITGTEKTSDEKIPTEVYIVVGLLQDAFNIWLGVIFGATIMQICNCLYQFIEGYGIDVRYLIFIGATIAHIYLPCRYAAKLKATAAEVPNRLHCCGWENAADRRARKMIAFMIARAQVPLNLTAFNMINFDMELFVSILKTAYSVYTLLRP